MVYNSDFVSLWQSGLSGQRFQTHVYDTTDAITTVRASGYITDAEAKGIQVGDLIHVRQWTTTEFTAPLIAYQLMIVVSIAADGSADLSDGTPISVTDTD